MELQQEPKEYPGHTRRWCCANTRFLIGQGNGWRHFTRYGNYSGMRERGMRTRIESIYVLTTVTVEKTFFFKEEMVNDRKIAGLGVQKFSTVLCTISLSSSLRKYFNISCYVIFYSLRFVRISAGRGWWKELSSTWRKEMWLSRPSVQMRCSRFVLRLRFAQKNLRKVEETQIKEPTQFKI